MPGQTTDGQTNFDFMCSADTVKHLYSSYL